MVNSQIEARPLVVSNPKGFCRAHMQAGVGQKLSGVAPGETAITHAGELGLRMAEGLGALA